MTEMEARSVIDRMCDMFFPNILNIEHTNDKIKIQFYFPNGSWASIVGRYEPYEWKIMSPVIRNDDSIELHLTEDEVISRLIDIKQGITIY